ncbi:hypothetical protein [Bacteroides eggerthii]|jgi:hypothetical protein|uniref:hypothetical protein n=1 Tax=Bacteroides eggerthii TaxID=28111 RepID=UPI000E4B5E99|nr:hypothetical protein [Bacteroides eggerthii]RHJ41278.1 hypothetical protein DW130_06795 [Bacteroides eggerthii]
MMMKRNEEDEIQVLGTKPKKVCRKWVILLAVCTIITTIAVMYLFISKTVVNKGETDIARLKEETMQESRFPSEISMIEINEDSINDVPLRIYSLVNLQAELSMELPSRKDTAVLLVAQAADIRKDNKGIVGDFILRGKQLAIGKKETGYCAIINGNISLGNSMSDDVKDYCISNKGYFFRQYALVVNGEQQENRLKGKAIRRALAKQDDDLYIIESINRESLYDFSEALADIGITDALYLVGGDAYMFYRDKGQLHEHGEHKPLPAMNYIVFRKK